MADERDSSQQTEQPTLRRLDEAHSQGDVVKSHEVVTVILLAGGTLSIAIFGHSAARDLTNLFQSILEQAGTMDLGPADLMVLMRELLMKLAGILLPPLGLIMAAALIGHVAQGRPVFTTARMSLDLSKLSPMAGLRRLFGLDGLTNLGKGLVKMAIVGAVMWVVLRPELGRLEMILDQSPMGVASDMVTLLFKLAMAVLAILAVIAGADYFMQRLRFIQRNRMSKQEIKEEFRESEGDPAVKGRIRQIRVDRARRRMMAAVPRATVVITNPTHYAVALLYESGKMDAPVCVAKGVDVLALRIREVAEEHKVPIVENPPLARALYATVEVDDEIPSEQYKAVAEVIGYVMRLTGKIKLD